MTENREPDLHEDNRREADGDRDDSDPERLQEELAGAQARAKEAEDKYLRAVAEIDNIRRRAQIDISNAHKYGLERFVGELLPVRDSLELAKQVDLNQAGPSVVQKMQEGLDLTLRMMEGAFQKFGITLVDPQGQKFDPTQQQAVSMVETDQVPPNHVLQVMQKGYLLNERLLRPAMVVVAKPKEA